MIYFIGTEDYSRVKIGYTAYNPQSRMRDFQTGNSETLHVLWDMPGDQETEKLMQLYFSNAHVRGEWFSYNNEDFRKFKVMAELVHGIDETDGNDGAKIEKINGFIKLITKYDEYIRAYEKPKIGFI